MKDSPYEAIVGNIGKIGEFNSKTAARNAIRETIRQSGRADPYGYVLDNSGNLVADVGRKPKE